MILFGSGVSGEDAAESDIDLFIETADRTAVANRISQSENQDLRKLSLIIMTAGEFSVADTRSPAFRQDPPGQASHRGRSVMRYRFFTSA